MCNAVSFVNRASDDTKFDICIEGFWKYQNSKETALDIICEYEFEMDQVAMQNHGKVIEPWHADVMEWFISYDKPNTIALDIC